MAESLTSSSFKLLSVCGGDDRGVGTGMCDGVEGQAGVVVRERWVAPGVTSECLGGCEETTEPLRALCGAGIGSASASSLTMACLQEQISQFVYE